MGNLACADIIPHRRDLKLFTSILLKKRWKIEDHERVEMILERHPKWVKKSIQIYDEEIDEHNQPLHICCERSRTKIVKYMIKNGANVDKKDSLGKPPIYYAVHRSNEKIVKSLLEHNAKLNEYNPIYISARLGNINIFKALLERPDCVFDEREVIYLAAMNGHTSLLQCMFDRCSKRGEPFVINFDDFNDDGVPKNPLYFAVRGHHNSSALFLIKKGANVNRRKSLHYAVRNPQSENVAIAMVNAGADLTHKDAFKFAILGGRGNTVKAMLAGLNENTINNFTPPNSYDPPLYVAARRGHYSVFKTLLAHPLTHPNAPSQFKVSLRSSAIHVISRGNKQTMVRMMKRLLKSSTTHYSVNDDDEKEKVEEEEEEEEEENSKEPQRGRRRRIIDVNIQNKDGNTALHIAMLSPYSRTREIVRLLLSAGADYHILNKEKKTPLDYAFCETKKQQFEKWVQKIECQKEEGQSVSLPEADVLPKEIEKEPEIEEYFVPAAEEENDGESSDEVGGELNNEDRKEEEEVKPVVAAIEVEEGGTPSKINNKRKRYPFMIYNIDTTSEEEEEEGENNEVEEEVRSPSRKLRFEDEVIMKSKKKEEASSDFGFEEDVNMSLSNSMSLKSWKFLRKKVKNLNQKATAPPTFWRTSKARDRARRKLRLMFKRTGGGRGVDRNIRGGEIDYTNGRSPFDGSGSPIFIGSGDDGSPQTPVFNGKKMKILLDVENEKETKKAILNRLAEKAFGKGQGGLGSRFLGKKKNIREEEEEEDIKTDSEEGSTDDDDDDSEEEDDGYVKYKAEVKKQDQDQEEEEDVINSPTEDVNGKESESDGTESSDDEGKVEV